LHNEELHILYSPKYWADQIKENNVGDAWEKNVCKVLIEKPEEERPLGIPRRRWEDGIRMDLREIGWGSVDWIQLAQDRNRWRALVNTVMNLPVLAPR
jgi:hypothetical protein